MIQTAEERKKQYKYRHCEYFRLRASHVQEVYNFYYLLSITVSSIPSKLFLLSLVKTCAIKRKCHFRWKLCHGFNSLLCWVYYYFLFHLNKLFVQLVRSKPLFISSVMFSPVSRSKCEVAFLKVACGEEAPSST